ncbi:hypothetical protein [Legionella norrlandica]|nr:hypothetical protein [Legionella norrlandica]
MTIMGQTIFKLIILQRLAVGGFSSWRNKLDYWIKTKQTELNNGGG